MTLDKDIKKVLLASREITHLIMREKDPQTLIAESCRSLVETRGYKTAWIILWDNEHPPFISAEEAGYGPLFAEMRAQLAAGKLPACREAAMQGAAEAGSVDSVLVCADCPLHEDDSEYGSLIVRLEHQEKVFGLMSVNYANQSMGFEEEKVYLSEIAEELAFALHTLERNRRREESDAALREQQRWNQLILDGLPFPTMLIRRDRTILVANKAAQAEGAKRGGLCWRDFGQSAFISREDKAYINDHNQVPPNGTHCTFCLVEDCLENQEPGNLPQLRAWDKIWDTHWVPFDEDTYLHFAIDVTQQAIAERDLKASEKMLQTIFDHSMDGVVIRAEKDMKFRKGNETLLKWTGYSAEEFHNLSVRELHPSEALAGVMENIRLQRRGEQQVAVDVPVQRKDGSVFYADIRSVAIQLDGEPCFMTTFRDSTERKQLQASMAESDRLSSMGLLAAGVAHEINNPLAYVLYNLDSLSEDLPRLFSVIRRCLDVSVQRDQYSEFVNAVGSDAEHLQPLVFEDILSRLREAREGGQRIRDIARGLRIFAHADKPELEPVRINYVLDIAANMASNEIKYRAKLRKEYRKVPGVLANEGKLSQVFLNLLMNAAQATEEGKEEENEIRLRTWRQDDEVLIEVSDTGTGIESAHLSKVFEPFYSTKEAGVGTGLGLSISNNIIESFGGHIEVTSELGVGTSFVVYLPIQEQQARAPEVKIVPKPRAPAPPESSARILIVDDEIGIRKMLRRILKHYQVVDVCSGHEAQELLREDQAFDLILCDMMMPAMSGLDLHEWISTAYPPLVERVIFMTGGAFTPKARAYLKKISNTTIEKPFNVGDLKTIVSEFLKAHRLEGL